MSTITVEATINGDIETVWKCWTEPEHIMQWNQASPDWECPSATNDLRTGGKFSSVMAAKDKSFSFEFGGTYTDVVPMERIVYVMSDGRKVEVSFSRVENVVRVTETFDPEDENPEEMQRDGWQSILDNFKAYVEKQVS